MKNLRIILAAALIALIALLIFLKIPQAVTMTDFEKTVERNLRGSVLWRSGFTMAKTSVPLPVRWWYPEQSMGLSTGSGGFALERVIDASPGRFTLTTRHRLDDVTYYVVSFEPGSEKSARKFYESIRKVHPRVWSKLEPR